MRNRIYLSLTCLILLSNNWACAQNTDLDSNVILTLKEFYTGYSAIKFNVKNIRRLDSIQRQYCSLRLRKQLNEEFKANGLDHDLLTNDNGIDSAGLKTLTVIKDQAKPNTYIVSYITHTLSASYKPIDTKVVIHVTVVKENGNIKIASTDMSK